ncbi:MAG: hypothetical protein IPO00_08935 [Betaproteobacteria bacterium]|nr:hypothetical protein [Betaproteobacteria bacterium]
MTTFTYGLVWRTRGRDTGSEASDTLTGTHQADTLQGGAGNDTLIGQRGNDLLEGGEGNDIYAYNLGDGQDLIRETDNGNHIVFGAGLDLQALQVKWTQAPDGKRYLDLDFGNAGDTLSIEDGALGRIAGKLRSTAIQLISNDNNWRQAV